MKSDKLGREWYFSEDQKDGRESCHAQKEQAHFKGRTSAKGQLLFQIQMTKDLLKSFEWHRETSKVTVWCLFLCLQHYTLLTL